VAADRRRKASAAALLNALPVQIDLFYRTGASAVAIRCLVRDRCRGRSPGSCSPLTDRCRIAAATAVFALNPNVIYLQSTPMTSRSSWRRRRWRVAMSIRVVRCSCRKEQRAFQASGCP